MKATVISVVKTKMKDKYDGFDFTYQGEPYQGQQKPPTTRFVFGNSDMAKPVSQLEAGQTVNLTFVKEGKFSNLVGVEVLQGYATPKTGAAPAGKVQTYDDTQKRISRSAAMKEATVLVLAKATPKATIGDLVGQVKDVTRDLEKFLTFEDEVKELTDGIEGVNPDDDIPF